LLAPFSLEDAFKLLNAIVGSEFKLLVFDASFALLLVVIYAINKGTISFTDPMLRARLASFEFNAVLVFLRFLTLINVAALSLLKFMQERLVEVCRAEPWWIEEENKVRGYSNQQG
jgi:hypothetical protein